MAWTWPTALFFAAIAIAIVAMTVLEILYPTEKRRGWLPLATTRGDRFFIALLAAAFVHLAWLALVGGAVWIASLLSIALAGLLLRWG